MVITEEVTMEETEEGVHLQLTIQNALFGALFLSRCEDSYLPRPLLSLKDLLPELPCSLLLPIVHLPAAMGDFLMQDL